MTTSFLEAKCSLKMNNPVNPSLAASAGEFFKNPMKMIPTSVRRLFRWLCLGMGMGLCFGNERVQAVSSFQTNDLINAFNTAFYVDQGTSGYYRAQTGSSSPGTFWDRAEQIEMLIDAHDRTSSSTYLTMISELCNGFTGSYGTSWTPSNTFNDDIMWAAIAFCRAYQKTGNTNFRTYAKSNFDACYTRAWDTAGGGGLWWTTAKTSKNSCVNFPGAIAAYYLYQTLGDSSYLTKSQNIFNWGKANLWNSATGQVYDSVTNFVPTTYNQGTFVGAANFLGDVASATTVADYTRDSMGTMDSGSGYRMMITYDPTSDGGGFNGICARWIARFMGDRNLQSNYLGWLQANVQNQWDRRRTSDNLSWCKPWENTPEGTAMDSFGCSSTVAMAQVVPVTYVSSATYALINRKSGLAANTSGGATTNNTPLIQSSYTGASSMKWNVTNIGGNQYKITQVASGRAMSIDGASMNNDAIAKIYDYLDVTHQKVTFVGNHGNYYSILFVHSGKALTVYAGSTSPGAALIQYTHNNGSNAQWNLRNP
jgi:predicted alpha-1,6-mannanase (GH76 family)